MDVAEPVVANMWAFMANMWAFMASWVTPITLFCFLNFMVGTIFLSSNFKSNHHKPAPPSPEDEQNRGPPQLVVRASSILERVRTFNFPLYRSKQTDDPLQFSTHHLDPTTSDDEEDEPNNPPQLVRAPSILERDRSFDSSLYRSKQTDDPLQFSTHHLDLTSSDDEEDEPINQLQLVRAPSILERVRSFNFSLYRSEQPDPLQPQTHHVDEGDIRVTRTKSDTTGKTGRGPAKMRKSASEKLRVAEEEEAADLDLRRPATTRERNTENEEGVDAMADNFIDKFRQQLKLQRVDSVLRFRDMLNRGT